MGRRAFALSVQLAVGLILITGCASQHGGRPAAAPHAAPAATPPAATPAGSQQPATEEAAPPPPAPDCPLCVDPTSPKVLAAYAAAIESAKYPAPEKISRDLTPLLATTDGLVWDDQGRILMSTWTRAEYYSDLDKYSHGKTFPLYGDTWFTAVPLVRDFCRALGLDGAMLTLRLEQLIGLPPDNGDDVFLEVWVDPTDIFRPCPDPEISDHECQVEIPVIDRASHAGARMPRDEEQPWDCTVKRQVSGRYVTVHPGHLRWMCDNWASSYGNDDPLENYPWTALGYTYDWGNPGDPRGMSEYVAPAGSLVVFESLTPTELYCTSPSDG